MAHASCPSGHGMWNGDGKPIVRAFRVDFFRDFMKEHPDCKLGDNGEYWQLYDCVNDISGEDLDCWYCDECKGLTIFVDNSRYDFKRMDVVPDVSMPDVSEWEEYIALRERDFEQFQDYYEGMSPLEAIKSYDFEYRYKLSPDKKIIYAFGRNDKVKFGYRRCCYQEFSVNVSI